MANKNEKKEVVEKMNTKKEEKTVAKKSEEKNATSKAKTKSGTFRTSTTKTNIVKKTAKTAIDKKNNSTTSRKVSSNKTNRKSTKKQANEKVMLAEYYDLPYRYNETIVKILAQTPTTIFVYWDISDEDRKALIDAHGENFFYETKPVLIVHNTTKNYSFEIEINDFANSWYIRLQEPDCNYIIDLGRRYNKINNEQYIYINSSNNIVSPNNHFLSDNVNLGHVLFKNVKTNKVYAKDFRDLKYMKNINKIYGNIYNLYNSLYSEELLNELSNPSSSEFHLNRKR